MLNAKRLLLCFSPIALLAACGDSAVEDAEASGEVLEGTISDAMLPLDRVRSQAPLAAPTARSTGSAEQAEQAGEPDAAEPETDDGAEPPADAEEPAAAD